MLSFPTLRLPIIAVVLFAFGLGCSSPDDSPTPTGPSAPATLNYLALGDSYTIGQGVTEEASFPYQLTDALQLNNYNVAEPKVIARTGWRSDNLLTAIADANLNLKYDLVTVLIGVNDQFQGVSVGSFRQNLNLVFDQAQQLAENGREDVLVLTIPDYSATRFAAQADTQAIRLQLEQFNQVVLAEAAARNLQVVDITSSTKAARSNQALLASDGLHPSGQLYAQWVDLALPEARQILD